MFLGQKIKSVSNFAISDYQSIPKYVIPTFHPNAESWAELPAMRKSRRSFVFLSVKTQLISDLWRSYGTFRGFGLFVSFALQNMLVPFFMRSEREIWSVLALLISVIIKNAQVQNCCKKHLI